MRTILMYLDGALCGPGPLRPRFMVHAIYGHTGDLHPMTEVVFMSRDNAYHWVLTQGDPDTAYAVKEISR